MMPPFPAMWKDIMGLEDKGDIELDCALWDGQGAVLCGLAGASWAGDVRRLIDALLAQYRHALSKRSITYTRQSFTLLGHDSYDRLQSSSRLNGLPENIF